MNRMEKKLISYRSMNESDPKKLKKHQMTKLLLKQNIEPERRTPKGKTRQIPAH